MVRGAIKYAILLGILLGIGIITKVLEKVLESASIKGKYCYYVLQFSSIEPKR